MQLTRDSLVLWLGIFGSLAAYFAVAEHSPDQWNWHEWMQFAVATIGVVAGKLATSPLPGATPAKP
jgi:hypothetical protein